MAEVDDEDEEVGDADAVGQGRRAAGPDDEHDADAAGSLDEAGGNEGDGVRLNGGVAEGTAVMLDAPRRALLLDEGLDDADAGVVVMDAGDELRQPRAHVAPQPVHTADETEDEKAGDGDRQQGDGGELGVEREEDDHHRRGDDESEDGLWARRGR